MKPEQDSLQFLGIAVLKLRLDLAETKLTFLAVIFKREGFKS